MPADRMFFDPGVHQGVHRGRKLGCYRKGGGASGDAEPAPNICRIPTKSRATLIFVGGFDGGRARLRQ